MNTLQTNGDKDEPNIVFYAELVADKQLRARTKMTKRKSQRKSQDGTKNVKTYMFQLRQNKSK